MRVFADELDDELFDVEEENIDPTELAGIFSSTAEWAISELGAQQVRDLLEAVIELDGRERN